eukprot:TRINITY_DN215_c0_g2_i2.p1 TRINITY_DN215_c0_g2~~TRINITY_DN215_c0_g2_i2.p1  ORF type:complete len:402 (+),score=71.99 TRINITY_DN215_c0_g2_i2:42-1208(+)
MAMPNKTTCSRVLTVLIVWALSVGGVVYSLMDAEARKRGDPLQDEDNNSSKGSGVSTSYTTHAMIVGTLVCMRYVGGLFVLGKDCGGGIVLNFTYFTLSVITLLIVNSQDTISWRQLELAERSLASGGEMLTSCLTATNPQRMTVEPNITYYTLADKEWHVEWSSRSTFTVNGWTWLSAPIVYDGPVEGCRFDPPIYAGCITKDVSPEGCGFRATGPDITIRKLSQSDKLEAGTRQRIPYDGMVRDEYVMEWGSRTRRDTRDHVDRVQRAADDKMWNISIAWGLVTAVLAVWMIYFESNRDGRYYFFSRDFCNICQRGLFEHKGRLKLTCKLCNRIVVPECISITKTEAANMTSYTCPKCPAGLPDSFYNLFYVPFFLISAVLCASFP